MIDDALLCEDIGEDLGLGDEGLDLDDDLLKADPAIFLEPEDDGRGLKRTASWDDLVRVVSDESDGEITSTERDELQEFLEDHVSITEPTSPTTAPTTPDTVDFWDAATTPTPEDKQEDTPAGAGSVYYDPTNGGSFRTMPPKKRTRCVYPPSSYHPHPVTPPTPHGAPVSMLSPLPTGPPMGSPPPAAQKFKGTTPPAPKGKGTFGKTQNKNRRTRLTVPFEEMQRLMATYGPIKVVRKRKCKPDDENGASAKQISIKRKFYRWFPDFEQRELLLDI
jgi:hypothetical protein